MSSGPSSEPEPVTAWMTSRGSPASSNSGRAPRALNGVWLSALNTTALPAAIAGTASLMLRVNG